MSPAARDLRNQAMAVLRDPDRETASGVTALLQEWLQRQGLDVGARRTPTPTEFNGTMMQWFHWYSEGDGRHWRELKAQAPALAAAGITALWLPPATKGGSVQDVGYGAYDLFDLGEFDQKGTVRTKYGTRQEYSEALQACRQHGIQVYADVVFDHKLFGDAEEDFLATPFDPQDRNRPLGPERTIRSWTHFREPRKIQQWLD